MTPSQTSRNGRNGFTDGETAVNSLRSVYGLILWNASKVSLRSRSRFKSVPYVPYRTYEGGASPFPEEHIRGF